jgi:neutral ceramidase
MNLSTSLFLLGSGLTLAVLSPSLADENWKAGVAKVKITPQKLLWLSGKDAREKPATSTLDELWAKALVLEDPEGSRAVLVTLDLIGIGRKVSLAIRDSLQEKYGLERRQVALCTSHTHNSPVVGDNLKNVFFLDTTQQALIDEYAERLKGRVLALVGEAIRQRTPAQLSWGTGRATFAINRRENPRPVVAERLLEGAFKGPVDHDVPVLSVTAPKGRLRAVVFGYACHPIWLRHFYRYSADYPGVAQTTLEESHEGIVAMFFAGCGGDQDPLSEGGKMEALEARIALLPQRHEDLAIREIRKNGRELAAAVEEVLAARMTRIAGHLATSYAEIDLPLDALPTRVELERQAASANRYVARLARQQLETIERGEPRSPTYPYPVAVWRLGSQLVFVGLGGEVVVDYSLRLKRELGPGTTWVAGYTNDVMAYIPSLRVLREGGAEGYGAMVYYGLPTRWAPRIEELIVRSAVEQAKALTTARGGR